MVHQSTLNLDHGTTMRSEGEQHYSSSPVLEFSTKIKNKMIRPPSTETKYEEVKMHTTPFTTEFCS